MGNKNSKREEPIHFKNYPLLEQEEKIINNILNKFDTNNFKINLNFLPHDIPTYTLWDKEIENFEDTLSFVFYRYLENSNTVNFRLVFRDLDRIIESPPVELIESYRKLIPKFIQYTTLRHLQFENISALIVDAFGTLPYPGLDYKYITEIEGVKFYINTNKKCIHFYVKDRYLRNLYAKWIAREQNQD